tara:strand:- start:13817 stop:14221 length:405 start_codon:yes stop_codon:yes gene_type:complete
MNINSINMEIDDISNDNEYNKFIEKLDRAFQLSDPYRIIIDTAPLERQNINIRYLYKLKIFIKKNKKNYNIKKNLKETIVKVYNDTSYKILFTLFTVLTSPLAKVIVIYYNYDDIDKSSEQRRIKKIKEYLPEN